MKIEQRKFSKEEGWETLSNDHIDSRLSNLVLVFGSTELLSDPSVYVALKTNYPNASILLNTTAGEITDIEVNDNTISVSAILFEKTTFKTAITNIKEVENSFAAGRNLAEQLPQEGLKNVFVISDGHQVNGSELVMGLQQFLPNEVIITGGLAGDGARFERTLVGLNETPVEGRIVVIGFYGESLQVTHGSVGGWDSFGQERLITKSNGNVLYELDDRPALDIYKLYLGEYVSELPMSALLFPLSIRNGNNNSPLVRTILSVNEEEKSLTFAGNMPQGGYARLMKSNFDGLIAGAASAADHSLKNDFKTPDLAILISCVGRKLVLNQRIEEEIEVVRSAYGPNTIITGFYSYGEISPIAGFTKCELHNQTMTITTLTEI